jgi:hypothetical protein
MRWKFRPMGKTCRNGTVIQVSNWLLRSWFIPGAAAPYKHMTFANRPGAVPLPGPLQTAPGQGGNYQIISKWGGDRQVFAAAHHLMGDRRKGMHRRLKQLGHLAERIGLCAQESRPSSWCREVCQFRTRVACCLGQNSAATRLGPLNSWSRHSTPSTPATSER